MIQDINSRVYLVEYISGEIVKLLEEYEVSREEIQMILYEIEQKMESPQERA